MTSRVLLVPFVYMLVVVVAAGHQGWPWPSRYGWGRTIAFGSVALAGLAVAVLVGLQLNGTVDASSIFQDFKPEPGR